MAEKRPRRQVYHFLETTDTNMLKWQARIDCQEYETSCLMRQQKIRQQLRALAKELEIKEAELQLVEGDLQR